MFFTKSVKTLRNISRLISPVILLGFKFALRASYTFLHSIALFFEKGPFGVGLTIMDLPPVRFRETSVLDVHTHM